MRSALLIRLTCSLLAVWVLHASAAAVASAEGLAPWSSNTDPTDVAKSHVQDIADPTRRYTITQGGTMDGRNCRSPMGCGMSREGAFYQSWESNRSVRMENVGDGDVINPWLSNGHNDFRTVNDIAAAAIVPGMSDGEKAFALWFQEVQFRHHSPGDNNELGDPVKLFNVYGYNTCGNDSIAVGTLLKSIGLKSAPARALGHCISQAFYDNDWHFYDGDMHSVYLLRDNKTVAGEQDIVRDHDLVKRTHSQGILFPDTWWQGQSMPAIYCYAGPVSGERAGKADTTMNMRLRPGEAIEWRWGQLSPMKYHGALHTSLTYEKAPHLICNGLWEYRPDLTRDLWRRGATVQNIAAANADGITTENAEPGSIIWAMASPYVLVGGRIEAESTGGVKFSISQDEQKTWRPVSAGKLDAFFSTVGPAFYHYHLKCDLAPGAHLKKLAIINDLQMAPLALPAMAVGENAFTYADQSQGPRHVRITHNWVERSSSQPPLAPPAAIYPLDAGESAGTDIVFQWQRPDVPDGGAIGDYHFELSRRPDMRLPLSMDFYKLISRTPDARVTKQKDGNIVAADVKSQYTLASPGLLTPDETYYWHVRAMNAQGVWGPWSKTRSFTARGVAYPIDVSVDFDAAANLGTLRWKPNPIGKRPAKYRIYGSDEKGFSASDQRFQGTVGVSKAEMADWNPWFPANFIAETPDTQLAVLGAGVTLPAANKTYYRVVAVDDRGKRSGPSDYAAAPRPVIYSKPLLTAQVGAEYRAQISATRSLGDLTSRMKGNDQINGYFDIEHPAFSLVEGAPAWLHIDPSTGLLSGTPDTRGKFTITLTASIDRQVRQLDEKALTWGNEKVLATTTERVGSVTQTFVIDVQ